MQRSSVALAVAIVAYAACARHDSTSEAKPDPAGPKPAMTTAPATTPQHDVVLTWKMTKKPKAIAVWYRIENKSKARVYVADKQLVNMQQTREWRAVPHIRVDEPADKPDAVDLIIGPPSGDASIASAPMTFVAVEPGAAREDTREVELPLMDGEQGPIKVPEGHVPTYLVFATLPVP